MKKKKLIRNWLLAVIMAPLALVSCLDLQSPEHYYTFVDDNIASYLEKNSDDFSTFISLLECILK